MAFRCLPKRIREKLYIDGNECWNYTGFRDKQGYGKITLYNVSKRVHCISFKIYYGDIPKGFQVHHICNNTSCCNPDHLEAVTPSDNSRYGKGWYKDENNEWRCRFHHYPEKYHYMIGKYKTCGKCRLTSMRNFKELERILN